MILAVDSGRGGTEPSAVVDRCRGIAWRVRTGQVHASGFRRTPTPIATLGNREVYLGFVS